VKGTLTGILICLFTISSFAQAKTIKFAGKVTDASTGSPLVGASVLVDGTAVGTRTDVEGNFFLMLATEKKYTIRISNVGYQTKQLTDLLAGLDANVIDVALERASGDLGNVVIKANARRETVATLYSLQKNSSAISDAISAEVIKKSPDRNTSEVLRRVSGTSIQDNKFVIIRGLSERYNTSMLNNSVLPSTEPDKKAFSFDIIPSSLIDNITIFKSATPDLPGDFSGGAVKISTRDFPSKKVSELELSVGYNSLTTGKDFYRGYPKGKLDWLGYFDDQRLIPGSYYQYRGSAYSNVDNSTKLGIAKKFPNSYGSFAANQSQPNFGFSYTGGNTKLIKDNKLGYIYSISYNNGRRVVGRERNEFPSYDLHDYTYNTTSYDMRSSLSGLLNLTYSYKKSKLSWKNLYNNDFVNSHALRNGIGGSGGVSLTDPGVVPFNYKSQNTEAAGNGILNSVVEGLHSLNKKWTIDWNASYGLTYRWQPDQHLLTFVSDPGTSNYYIKLNNENSPIIKDAGRVYSFLTENIFGASANVSKQFQWRGQTQKLKFGTLNYYRQRTVEVDGLGLATTSPYGTRINETKSTTFNNLMDPANIDAYGIIYGNIPSNSTDYSGKGLLNSGYAMLDNKFSDKVKLTWGVRAEKYLQELTAKGKNKTSLDNTDILPSLLFTYALTNKTNIRLAGSEAVNRPEFREMADYRVYDYENNFTVIGKPGLKRSKSMNGDLRFETFPNAGEIFSVSVFYKYFNDPIEQVNLGNDVVGYDNAQSANVYGVEMELRKRLSFINNSFFERVVFYTNAAYMSGSVKYSSLTINSLMQGQSPYLVNGGLSYTTDNDKMSFNVLYNRIGQRLKFRGVLTQSGQAAGNNIFENSRDVVDFQVSKKFLNNRLEAKFTVSDLLGQPYSWYYKYDADPSRTSYNTSTDRVLNSYKYGTSMAFKVRYSF
jgi:TonB-dependent receptor